MSSAVKQGVHVIDKDTRSLISLRYKRMTKAINIAFWDSDSETNHSLYVGSYGKHRYYSNTRKVSNQFDKDIVYWWGEVF